jgi:hypothetical protein
LEQGSAGNAHFNHPSKPPEHSNQVLSPPSVPQQLLIVFKYRKKAENEVRLMFKKKQGDKKRARSAGGGHQSD